MLTAAPARAGGQTRLQCDAACVTSHPGSIDRALARCGPATKNFLDNFPGFFREISGGAVYDACVAGVLAEDAYQRAQCIADCDDHCSTFGTRDTCEAHVEPVSAAGVAPPPQVWNPSGCGCVDGDTCCVCPSCDNGVGLCCIYGDCRCVA